MNNIFNARDLKKQLRALPEKTASWNYKDASYPDDPGPVIELPVMFVGKEPVNHHCYDLTGTVHEFLWIGHIRGYGFDVYQKTYFSAEISEEFDWEHQALVCSTQSWQKVLRICRNYYKTFKSKGMLTG